MHKLIVKLSENHNHPWALLLLCGKHEDISIITLMVTHKRKLGNS